MPDLNPPPLDHLTRRLESERNVWFASVRPDGRPHLVPIWFVWSEGKLWIATGETSQKRKNIAHQPRVCLALEDGNNAVVIEGTAAVETDPTTRDRLAPQFAAKYEWDFRADAEYGLLIAVTPTRLLKGGE